MLGSAGVALAYVAHYTVSIGWHILVLRRHFRRSLEIGGTFLRTTAAAALASTLAYAAANHFAGIEFVTIALLVGLPSYVICILALDRSEAQTIRFALQRIRPRLFAPAALPSADV
jgi:hypothetical protein